MTFVVQKNYEYHSVTRQKDCQNRQNLPEKSKIYFLNAAAFKAPKAMKLSEGSARMLI